MHILDALTADERSLAIQYQLKEYFDRSENFLSFVVCVKGITLRKLGEVGPVDLAKDKFSEVIEIFLEHSDELYRYVNGICSAQNGNKNVFHADWKRICSVCSKIVIQMGWEYEGKE